MLFSVDEIPQIERNELKNKKGIEHPLWTENKARLIQTYLKLFTFVTKHGVYIDGFAAPQERDRLDLCSANLVLQNEPKWMNEFFLCDLDMGGVEILREIQAEHHANPAKRKVRVLQGNFNQLVAEILESGVITEKTATFALLDQRTFECEWETVRALARHKKGTKIEIFYFLATGWLDRSIAASSKEGSLRKIADWWGGDDWQQTRGMNGIERAKAFCRRFQNELGYKYAVPFAIHDRAKNGRIMYHMIHATDHPDATPLMLRAYRKVSGRPDADRDDPQMDWVELINELASSE